MKFLRRMAAALGHLRVGQQLFAAFSLLLVLTAVVGGVALFGLAQVDKQASALANKWLQGVGHLDHQRAAVGESLGGRIDRRRGGDHIVDQHDVRPPKTRPGV